MVYALAFIVLGVIALALVAIAVCRAVARVDELQREADDTWFI